MPDSLRDAAAVEEANEDDGAGDELSAYADEASSFLLRIMLINCAPRPIKCEEGLGRSVGLVALLVCLRSGGEF